MNKKYRVKRKRKSIEVEFVLTLICMFLLFFQGIAAAGSAGVKNGSISGVVYGDEGPLSEVYVVAVREGEPPIIRSVLSSTDGTYVFHNLPLGNYTIGYSRFGYKPITTEEGDPENQSAVGEQTRTFVESGTGSIAPDTYLIKLPGGEGPSEVEITLVDAITGEPIKHATILIGSAVADGGGNGNYNADVNAEHDEDGELQQQKIVITADGYEEYTSLVTIPGGEATNQTIAVKPMMVTLSGVVQLDPSLDPAEYTNIQVVVPNVPSKFSQGQVLNGTGLYEVSVPASNGKNTRLYSIQFRLNGHNMTSVNNVVAPRAGGTYVKTPVTIQANNSAATGRVALSNGSIPTSDGINSAVIVELGQSITVNNGTFSFSQVPIGRPLTIEISVRNPDTGAIEIGRVNFTATEANGSFNLPTIITEPATQ